MDLITHELRTEHWKGIIAQCQARPDGVSTKQWLKDNQVKKAYYYCRQGFRNSLHAVECYKFKVRAEGIEGFWIQECERNAGTRDA